MKPLECKLPMKTLIRYIKLYLHFVSNCTTRELLFRTHLILSFSARLMLFGLYVMMYDIIYKNAASIGSLHYDQALLYLSIFFLVDTIGFTFFIKNFSTFPEYISEGKLDIVLTKPVDSQFFVSMRYFSLTSLFSTLPPLGLFIRQIGRLHVALDPYHVFLFVLFLVCTLTIYYSIWFITNLILFWVHRIDALHEFFVTIWRFMQFPPDIFQGVIRLFFLFIVPILLTIEVPMQALTGSTINISHIFLLVGASVLSLLISRILWKMGLRRYQSTG